MDWLGVALSIGGMWLLPKHYKWAIALFIVGNFVWTAYALPNGIWSIVGLQCVFLVLNVRAWRRGGLNAMQKTGWIVPYSWIDKRITSFQWFSQKPAGGIKANMDGNIFTILEGHSTGCKIYVKEGIITNYVMDSSQGTI